MDDAQEICDRYGPLVWRHVYRILGNHANAMDCCQEVLCEAWQKSGHRELHEASLTWLATRRAIDRLRKRKRSQDRLQATTALADVSEQELGPADNAEYQELLAALRESVAQLPSPQGEAFWLRCVDELSYAEIADQLGINTNAVGVLIHRAKSELRTMLASFSNHSVKD